ncbi:PP2C family protein-serine/threonine phosphatase [Geobacter argillaceus]|uniref:Serine phosphatase RsbU (Regulator of sigma subunit) n=1 Tax=Geobacter argillaceus TaxID=345631 RepID=A0A562VN49_9BACT|nr:SpoIIE family protein phosphatase [Geobacter argillaceus]TWJ19330.1 serine phosphatase RsbU (regulator of sigma subunit) [Geobacter argillaceus]
MKGTLGVLIIDDSERDALLLVRALRKEGIEPHSERVDTAEAMERAMTAGNWDLAISDCHMPEFTVEEALAIWQREGHDQPFIVVSGAIGEEEAVSLLKAGAHDFVKKDNFARLVPAIERELRDSADRHARREAEDALSRSEVRRLQLQSELNCAAEVQRKLLPQDTLSLSGFEIAALCIPARQVGGDFYDWYETIPGIVTLTFGDVMGKGLAAAMLMTTVRATLRAVTLRVQPSIAVQMAEQSLRHDLNRSESFVTLFLGRLNVEASLMSYVDCGHGLAFLRRRDGRIEELPPRGLPLGVSSEENYQEGGCVFERGDALVLYSDGVIDAEHESAIDNTVLSARLEGAATAREMVDRIVSLAPQGTPLPDDLTVLVVLRP